jgi:hypothetical protein
MTGPSSFAMYQYEPHKGSPVFVIVFWGMIVLTIVVLSLAVILGGYEN